MMSRMSDVYGAKRPVALKGYPVDSGYPHDGNNQCIILSLQLSFVMINVQLMLIKLILFYSLIIARFCNNYLLILLFLFIIIIFICAYMLKIVK